MVRALPRFGSGFEVPMPLYEGQVLEGKYVITRLLAKGGIGSVYLAAHRPLGKDVAIKVLHDDIATDDRMIERFEREARVACRIHSAHVTNVFDLGALPSGERFIVMEYLHGETLRQRIERDGPVPPHSLSRLAGQILDGLAATHEVGVVHRDLKPENIFLVSCCRESFVKLVDFGIAKLLAPPRGGLVTTAGQVFGTWEYMSPEQALGHTSAIDHRTDLYALGVILYEAATGKLPFRAENMRDILFQLVFEEPAPLSSATPIIDPAFAAIVAKAMAKAPDERFQSADEMRDALATWLSASAHPSALSPPPVSAPSSREPFETLIVSAPPTFVSRRCAAPAVAARRRAAAGRRRRGKLRRSS